MGKYFSLSFSLVCLFVCWPFFSVWGKIAQVVFFLVCEPNAIRMNNLTLIILENKPFYQEMNLYKYSELWLIFFLCVIIAGAGFFTSCEHAWLLRDAQPVCTVATAGTLN